LLNGAIESLSPASIALNLTCPEAASGTFARDVCTGCVKLRGITPQKTANVRGHRRENLELVDDRILLTWIMNVMFIGRLVQVRGWASEPVTFRLYVR
jgi:hypothetical protein